MDSTLSPQIDYGLEEKKRITTDSLSSLPMITMTWLKKILMICGEFVLKKGWGFQAVMPDWIL